jgi:transcriptional regulator with XRE-family HTH domain
MDIGKRAIKRFGKQVKTLRLERGWTQEFLADELEVDRSYVSSLERGMRNPTLKTIARIASIFKVTISKLCGQI